jgi:abortive infection bacteriophage resistance protein
MVISDLRKAEICLARIGYYRLSAYWYPFRKSEQIIDVKTGNITINILDDFQIGTDFTKIIELYVFDKKLRMIVLDALERIEIGVRTEIALLLGQYSPWAHRDPNCFHGNFSVRAKRNKTFTAHVEWISRLDDKLEKSREVFAKHFKQKYPGSHLPIWIAVELLDFGALSHIYSGMTIKDKDNISARYGVAAGQTFETWMRCLNDVRNICAHHSRLWNKPLVSQPKLPLIGSISDIDHLQGDGHGQTRLYAALVIMRCMLRVINPSSTWVQRLKQHLDTLPINNSISLNGAGFPVDWKDQALWI